MSAPTLTAVVVDDEPLARDELTFLLGECGGVKVVGEAPDATHALEVVEQTSPDIAFVDLRMPGPDGITLAETLLSRQPDLSVVVVSAHDDGAVRAYEANVLDYLLKPVRLERLKAAVERARAAASSRASKSDAPLVRLAVRRRGRYVVVDIEAVVYFEVRDELVWAVTEDDRYALDLTLSAVESRVPEGCFFRSHRGALVRVDRIRSMEPAGTGTFELVLDHPDSPRLPLARERVRTLRELIPFAG